MDDIQRSNQHDDELYLNDMTHTDTDGRDLNDQSLSLNQLEHSHHMQSQSQYTYSKTNKSHIGAGPGGAVSSADFNQISQLSNLEQTERIMSLKTEIRGYQKIMEQQQSKIKEEINKRTKVEEAFTTSKLNNEQTIMAKIQQLLHEEEPNLEELMNMSLRQEKEKQATKDQ